MTEEHRKPSCLIHFKTESGFLTRFTDISLKKFLACHELWLDHELDGKQREIAVKKASSMTCNLHYHRSCYSKFTNRTSIGRSQTRCAKRKKDDEISVKEDENTITKADEAASLPPSKSLRSSTSPSAVKPRNQAVLPPICIICNEIYYRPDKPFIFFTRIDRFAAMFCQKCSSTALLNDPPTLYTLRLVKC